MQYFSASRQWYGCQRLGFLTSAQLLMYVCDCARGLYGHRKRVCTETGLWEREKIPCRSMESNARRYCTWCLGVLVLRQLCSSADTLMLRTPMLKFKKIDKNIWPMLYLLLCSKAIKNIPCGIRHRAQELCESRGGRPGLPVPNSKATPKNRAQELCESGGGRPGPPSLIVPMASVDVRQY